MTKVEIAVFAFAGVLAAAAVVVGATTGNAAVAGALAVLSPVAVIAYQSFWTRRSVDVSRDAVQAGRDEAEASRLAAEASLALVRETQRDRELAIQPFLTGGSAGGSPENAPELWLRNIGRGPATQIRVFHRVQGGIQWNQPAVLLGAGDSRPASTNQGAVVLSQQRGASGVSDYIVSETEPHSWIAYCRDQLGTWLRFNLSTGEPPELWHEDRANERRPEWAGFREYQ